GSSPVPRRIARLMFSAGMFAALASPMIVRRRGFMSGSPPPPRAATVNSLMMRVKILPRLASRAPFLCLIDAHLEWPDMAETLPLFGQDDPDIRARIPRASVVVAEHRVDAKTGPFESRAHLGDGQRAECQLEAMPRLAGSAVLDVLLLERRQMAAAILVHRLHKREMGAAFGTAAQLHLVSVLMPAGQVGYEIDAECSTAPDHTSHGLKRVREIAFADERLQDAIRREHHREA